MILLYLSCIRNEGIQLTQWAHTHTQSYLYSSFFAHTRTWNIIRLYVLCVYENMRAGEPILQTLSSARPSQAAHTRFVFAQSQNEKKNNIFWLTHEKSVNNNIKRILWTRNKNDEHMKKKQVCTNHVYIQFIKKKDALFFVGKVKFNIHARTFILTKLEWFFFANIISVFLARRFLCK